MIVVEPAAREDVLKLAEPLLSATLVSVVVPCLKVMVSPSGGDPKLELTVAVKATVCPTSEGLREEASVVVVAILFTVCVSDAEVLPRKLVSPPYMAVIVLDPSGREEVLKVAAPPLRVTVPRVTEFRLNVAEPVGIPPNCPDTLAVNVTVWPTTDGLTEDESAVEVVALDTLCVTTAELLALKLLSPG